MNPINNMPDWNAVMTSAMDGVNLMKGSWLLVLITTASGDV